MAANANQNTFSVNTRKKSGFVFPKSKQEDATQEVRVPIDKVQYEELKQLKLETRIPIGELVRNFIDWGLDVKAPSLRKMAQRLCAQKV